MKPPGPNPSWVAEVVGGRLGDLEKNSNRVECPASTSSLICGEHGRELCRS